MLNLTLWNILAALISITAVFSYINHRFIKLPTAIGVMIITLSLTIILVIAGKTGFGGIEAHARTTLETIGFKDILMHGMLSFLLFAGALHINLEALLKNKTIIMLLATVGIFVSTFIIGGLAWMIFSLCNIQIPFIYCLVFGALISPTDPIAVLGILKTSGAPKNLQVKIAGESLFNDGIGVVVFLVLVEIATGGHGVSVPTILQLLAVEVGGGAIFGLGIGSIAYYMLKSVDNYQVEVLITLALVMGGYAAATALHISGPIAMVIAGLIIGNHGRLFAMSQTTTEHLDSFWELIDEILNALLFVLIGMELIVLVFTPDYVIAAVIMIPAVLFSRFVCVAVPVTLLRKQQEFSHNAIAIMTWGGLRGGISVALALSLPPGSYREALLVATYFIVVFSIIVQGLTIKKLVKH